MVDIIDYIGWTSGGRDDFSNEHQEPSNSESEHDTSESARGFDASSIENPFGPNGVLARFGERIPFVNHGLQRLHELTGDQEALRRAQKEDPIGPDGYLTQVAEHIPFVNTIMQERFRNIGESHALSRAIERDPIGTHGFITKALEHIPIISDAVMVVHQIKGEDDAYERARATSLQNLLSKDGALTRVMELVPLSHLLAAAVHEASGNREEAKRALDFFKSWAQAFKPDSPFARVAELIPGPDAVAFALHMQGGHYAQALRSLTKTSWVNVFVDKVEVTFVLRSLAQLECSELAIDGIAVKPRQFSLLVGIRDVLTNFLIVDRAGHRRTTRGTGTNAELERLGREQKGEAFGVTEELLKRLVHEKATTQTARFMTDLPGSLEWLVQVINRRLPDWRMRSPFLDAVCPRQFPPLPRRLVREVQQALPRALIRHGPLPELRPVKLRRWQHGTLAAESVAAVGCFSALGACGFGPVVSGGACCAAGLACGAFELGRAAVRRVARWLDAWNDESWNDVAKDPQPKWSWTVDGEALRDGGLAASSSSCPSPQESPRESPACSPGASPYVSEDEGAASAADGSVQSGQPKQGVVFELLAEDASRLGRLMREYYLDRALGSDCRAGALIALEPLIRGVTRTVLETEDAIVPFVLEVDLDAWEVELPNVSFNAWMPAMRFAMVLHLNMAGRVPLTERVFMVFPDDLLHNVVHGLQEQLPGWDLRQLDPRFGGFRKPAHVRTELALSWLGPETPEITVASVQSRLDLPL